MTTNVAPLSGLRVLDLSEDVSGPYCTKLMAALGADVLKVERPGAGDRARSIPPFFHDTPGVENSGLFLYLNTAKRSITLNLDESYGRTILRRLVEWADVVVESFAPGTLAQWELDYPSLDKLKPGIILVSITPFGQTGPYRDLPASDLTLLALGGWLYRAGEAQGGPLKMGGQHAYYTAGSSAFSGAMTALYHRDATGEGQQVDVAIMEGVAAVQYHSSIFTSYTGTDPGRGDGFAPTLQAMDGWVGMVYRQREWEDLCNLIGMPELFQDPRFIDLPARQRNVAELNTYVSAWISALPKAEIYHLGQAMNMAFGYICTPKDLVESPQYQERQFFVEIDHPTTGPMLYPGIPFRMLGVDLVYRRAPLLGEHNQEVYCGELGYSVHELGVLRGSGIL